MENNSRENPSDFILDEKAIQTYVVSSYMKEFADDLLPYEVVLSEEQKMQFATFYENLITWNKVMNLTAITEPEDVWRKHFFDSCSLLEMIPASELQKNLRLIDVGTGAGFPGIPLAILFPQLKVTLMDSLQKRINFLQDTVEKLHLENVSLVHARVEELGKNPKYRAKFDLSVSRAVADLRVLSEYCLPLVAVGGEFLPYKAGNVTEELSSAKHAIALLGGKVDDVKEFEIPHSDYQRTLIKISKVKETPKKFPRKAGTPQKEPLS